MATKVCAVDGSVKNRPSTRPVPIGAIGLTQPICAVLDCTPSDLLICEADKVAARRPADVEIGAGSRPTPRLGRHTSVPPA